MAGKKKSKKGFGYGQWGGKGTLPWGGFEADPVINKSLKVIGYKAVLDVTKPATPKGFKGVKQNG